MLVEEEVKKCSAFKSEDSSVKESFLKLAAVKFDERRNIMPRRAHKRLIRPRYYVMSAAAVIVLSVVLAIELKGVSIVVAVTSSIGSIAVALMAGNLLFEKYLWKTKLGQLIGCPPDYSGNWVGEVTRSIQGSGSLPKKTKIEVEIVQELFDVKWNQVGYDDHGKKVTESHFIIGEVIDDRDDWSAICGVYEVTYLDENGRKSEGSQLVNVYNGGSEIRGNFSSNMGNVGEINLARA